MKGPNVAFTPDKAAEYWRNSKDEMMIDLANSTEGITEHPDEEATTEFVTFLCVFSMGCAELGLVDLSNKFKMRLELYMIGLTRMGFIPGKYKNYLWNRMVDGFYNRVVNLGTFRAAYRVCDLVRIVKDVKKIDK